MSAVPDNGSQGAGSGVSGLGAVNATAGGMHGAGIADNASETSDVPRSAPLRVDAQRNLEHVLRAAREVFGELGYGAPMEDVARRARVGVGTVYRRFPSKDVLVRRIAEEETARLTEQARAALGQEDEPWSALSRFLRTSVASGAGRLLPPRILRADARSADASGADGAARLPQQRQSEYGQEAGSGLRLVPDGAGASPSSLSSSQPGLSQPSTEVPGSRLEAIEEESGCAELLSMVGQLVQRARDAGELRADVTVGDVLLVIATAAPSLPDAVQQAAASRRLLDILLEGLRPRQRA
ncbi:TetR/AcrR family transcriptional regulator [Streptomyces ovatisporus]|uniref:TetR/AcrR family transcriptional regulator n=1 Tax=Streptomyces ovatisporus TaxID=1128682 RepID=A0ABV9AGM3_9ACTN